MLLRHSEFKGNSSYQAVRTLARQALGDDIEGYRREFLQLVDRAAQISGKDVAIRE
jgi:Ca-activated chloride channel family protein